MLDWNKLKLQFSEIAYVISLLLSITFIDRLIILDLPFSTEFKEWHWAVYAAIISCGVCLLSLIFVKSAVDKTPFFSYNYKENISRSTVTNYKNTKKLTDATIQGSWILNTDYIPEKLYPFYESIFVSPYLQLYDAKEDRLYDVILVNTEYNEKTFNNQSRNLFNLQLEVELDTTQNIIY